MQATTGRLQLQMQVKSCAAFDGKALCMTALPAICEGDYPHLQTCQASCTRKIKLHRPASGGEQGKAC